MTITCFICGHEMTMSHIVSHLQTHSDEEAMAAFRRSEEARAKEPPVPDEPVGEESK